MEKIWNILEEMTEQNNKRVYTIVTGKDAGKKAVLQNGRWYPEEEIPELFRLHLGELEAKQETGCLEVDRTRIFAEKTGGIPELVICGGGHVAVAVIHMAVLLGINVTVLEDRPSFADHARAAGAQEVICDTYEAGLSQIQADEDTYFVIVTRGHRYDQICVETISRMSHAYIGMMGSRKRVAIVKKEAVEHGADPDVIASLHAPIGLSIQAETPEEIAVSILAQIIAEKGKKRSSAGFSRAMLKTILDAQNADQKKVLATIISRKGSAPRAVGTKMLILQDGRTEGTIGGGCLEARVITGARELMAQTEKRAILMQADLTAQEAEEEGMVCGGILEVFLERI